MDFYEVINSRHSIRNFAYESIPKDILERIVKAAYTAPANDHFRDWNYIVVTDKEIMKSVIEGVPKNLTVKDVDAPSCLSDLNCYASVWCGIENVWLAAVSEGYGCNVRIPLGNEETVAKEALNIPDEYLIPCFIGVGRPAEGAALTKQIDVDYDAQIHWERF